MIKGKQNVLAYFDQVNSANENEYIYFSIYKKGLLEKGNAAISTPQNKEGWNYEQARQYLDSWLTMQQYGEFTIVINKKEQATSRGGSRQDFSIEAGSMGNNQQVISGPQYSNDDIETRITNAVNSALLKDKQDREMTELKAKVVELTKQNKDLEKQAGDPWNKVIGAIAPYMEDILVDQKIISKKAVAGFPNSAAEPVRESDSDHPVNDQSADDEDAQNRLSAVCRKFHKARPDDWLEVLEFFADKILEKPSLVETAKMFL